MKLTLISQAVLTVLIGFLPYIKRKIFFLDIYFFVLF